MVQRYTFHYKICIVWWYYLGRMVCQVIHGLLQLSQQYAFECDTFYVDKNARIYHLDIFVDDCDKALNAESLDKMKGYQMGKNIKICEDCEDMLEDYGP